MNKWKKKLRKHVNIARNKFHKASSDSIRLAASKNKKESSWKKLKSQRSLKKSRKKISREWKRRELNKKN